jgi:CRISPR/Cas system-associated exonuclease Cas4 (RecB family)
VEDYVSVLKEAYGQLTSSNNYIAVKDLTLCPRKKVYSKIDPLPMTDEEIYNYVSGQANHDVIARLFMMYPHRFRFEMEVRYSNIKGKVDVHDRLLNNIIDIKTSKSQKILLKPFKFHEQQVKYYMAMMDSEEGQILYQMNNFGKYFPFPVYMNTEERKLQLDKLEREAVSLQKAIDASDPALARGIYNDDEMKWLCNSCSYLDKCKTIRGSESEKLRIEASAIKTTVKPTYIELSGNKEPMKVDWLLSNHRRE